MLERQEDASKHYSDNTIPSLKILVHHRLAFADTCGVHRKAHGSQFAGNGDHLLNISFVKNVDSNPVDALRLLSAQALQGGLVPISYNDGGALVPESLHDPQPDA